MTYGDELIRDLKAAMVDRSLSQGARELAHELHIWVKRINAERENRCVAPGVVEAVV